MIRSFKFFRLNILIFKVIGLWVPIENEKSYKYRKVCHVYNAFCVCYSMLFFTTSQVVMLAYTYNNREMLIKNLNMASSYVVGCYKMFTWFYWRKEILDIMYTLENGFGIFDKYREFNPNSLIIKHKSIKDNLVKFFHSLVVSVSISYLAAKLIEVTFYGHLYEVYSNETGYRYEQELHYQSWIPFDPKASKTAHIYAVIMQFLGLLYGSGITAGQDMLYTALVIGTTAHLELLQGAFRTIRRKCAQKLKIEGNFILDPPDLIKAADQEMIKYIKHLQKILETCQLLENICSYLILFQLLISLVAICTALFLVSSIPLGLQLFGNDLLYLLCVEMQLALYCYTANELTQNAADIPQALYDGDWLSTSTNFRFCTLFTMQRMAQPVCLTIGKFMPLTLSTFVSIGRVSYSLLAVLKH